MAVPAVLGPGDWLTLAQIQREFGTTKKVVHARINAGALPAVRVGNRTWIRREDFERVFVRRFGQ